jgi:hypothetical protein
VLEPDVDVRGRVVADQHRRQAELAELAHLFGHFGSHPLGEGLPVDEPRSQLVDGQLDVADVEAERLREADSDLDVLLQALEVP